MCFGQHLIIHAVSVPSSERAFIERMVLPAAIRPAMNEIWPIRKGGAVIWPPNFALNDPGLAYLAQWFFNNAMRLAERWR